MASNEILWIQLQTEWLKSSNRKCLSRKDSQAAAAQFFKENKMDTSKIKAKITSLIWANKGQENLLAKAFAKQANKKTGQQELVKSAEPASHESEHADHRSFAPLGTNTNGETYPEHHNSIFPVTTNPEPLVAVHVVNSVLEENDTFDGDEDNSTHPRKKPAQNKCVEEINRVNSEIVYIQDKPFVRDNDREVLIKLKQKKRELEGKLKRLKSNEKASAKIRLADRISQVMIKSNPELSSQIPRKLRKQVGRPRIEEDQPLLLQTIAEIAIQNGAADERRRTESIRMCRTLDDLHNCLKLRGFELSRSPVYYRILPSNINRIDGKRHVKTVPVKLARARDDFRQPHEDSHFASATIKFLKDLAFILGSFIVAVISQDDKHKVPLALAAAKVQSPMLMHLEYKVTLPDHDWAVASRHKLTPSVYAGLAFNDHGEIGYSGPTYISIRSGKHDRSTADSLLKDFHRLMELESFKCILENGNGEPKPVLIMFVDGGPDENPRFPKTLASMKERFRKYNYDAIFCGTYAPHQSAYNPVERRMSPLSRDLAGVILNPEACGKHLDSNGKTIDKALELKNFENAGNALADIWSETVIDGYKVQAEYITPPISGTDSNGTDSRDEDWKAAHVRISKYLLQISKCNNVNCCWPKRSNLDHILGGRFLPTPILFRRSRNVVVAAEQTDRNKENFFGDLFKQLAFRILLPTSQLFPILPYDFYCPSEYQSLASKYCLTCCIYFPSAAAANSHKIIHRPSKSVTQVFIEPILSNSENDDAPCCVITNLQQWLKPVFLDEFDSS